jgi:HPt (histidine-containing phosphotransfer) domain-containing protein
MKTTMSDELLDVEAWRDFVELWSDEEAGVLVELLTEFLSDAEGRVKEIRAGLEAGQGQRVENAAHSLKSCSANFGAARLSDICRQIELSAREQMLDEAARAVPALREALAESREALIRELGRA